MRHRSLGEKPEVLEFKPREVPNFETIIRVTSETRSSYGPNRGFLGNGSMVYLIAVPGLQRSNQIDSHLYAFTTCTRGGIRWNNNKPINMVGKVCSVLKQEKKQAN